jgi:hypothetical protein
MGPPREGENLVRWTRQGLGPLSQTPSEPTFGSLMGWAGRTNHHCSMGQYESGRCRRIPARLLYGLRKQAMAGLGLLHCPHRLLCGKHAERRGPRTPQKS